ncbi:MAG: biotin/lipoyl-containing protein [Gemmatimonadales bacterium]
MKYFVTIAGRERIIEVDGERVVVDGDVVEAHLSVVPGTPLRHLLIDAASLTLSMERAEPGIWEVLVQGGRERVEVVDERTRHIRTLTGPGETRSGAASLRAPMPGLVARVLVVPGQQVEAGQGLIVLEAMKMENELRATAAGWVDSVAAIPGEAVEKGQVLVQLRAAPSSTGS